MLETAHITNFSLWKYQEVHCPPPKKNTPLQHISAQSLQIPMMPYLTHATLDSVKVQVIGRNSERRLSHNCTQQHLHRRTVQDLWSKESPLKNKVTFAHIDSISLHWKSWSYPYTCMSTCIGMTTLMSPIFWLDPWESKLTVNVCVSPQGRFFTLSNSTVKPEKDNNNQSSILN